EKAVPVEVGDRQRPGVRAGCVQPLVPDCAIPIAQPDVDNAADSGDHVGPAVAVQVAQRDGGPAPEATTELQRAIAGAEPDAGSAQNVGDDPVLAAVAVQVAEGEGSRYARAAEAVAVLDQEGSIALPEEHFEVTQEPSPPFRLW